ncbi:MAG: 30S ribosomal protein S2 [Candidatus Brockarchaeota archaeon]|nr:30S ribosomal protein S2 [Candidatus Brockarchaeota archaeon]
MHRDELLASGIQIGTKVRIKEMKPFIRTVRSDGLSILNLQLIDDRIRIASLFMSRFEPSKIVAVSGKEYGKVPVQKFCEHVGAFPVVGRFPPGLFSNPVFSGHISPEVVIVSDPKVDYKAITEASIVGVPVIGICDTDNSCSDVDLIIPGNNKGRRALAAVFYLLAREILRIRGTIPKDGELPEPVSAFESPALVEGD